MGIDLSATLARVDAIDAYFENIRAAPAPSGATDPTRDAHKFIHGDTPSWAFLELVNEAELAPDDHFCDLGCGTGRLVALAAVFCRRATGIELHAERASGAEAALAELGAHNTTVRCEDLCGADVADGTLFFSWWVKFPRNVRLRIAERVACAAGARVITTDWPMEHPRIRMVRAREQAWSLPTDVGGASTAPVFFHEVLP